jgi:diguanylate cyclase (GGDEF)-like protein
MPTLVQHEQRHDPRPSPFTSGWNLAVNLITIGFCAICVFFLLDARRTTWDQAKQSANNIASVLQTDIERNIELYDLSLQAVVDNLKEPDLDRISPALRQLVLFDRAATAKYLGAIQVLDSNGTVILDSKSIHPRPESFADRDFFTVHKANPHAGLYISRIGVDRAGDYVLGISRRRADVDGRFAGVVVGTLRLSYFDDLFRKMNLGPNSSLALLSTDGTLLARLPLNIEDIGRNLAGRGVFQYYGRSSRSGWFEITSALDGIRRVFCYRQIGDLPLILTVGMSVTAVEGTWWREAGVLGAVVLVLVGATFILKLQLRRELARRLKAEEALSALARTDALTGLPNRRHFDEALAREWQRALDEKTPVGLLMIDADHFKAYNDELGHQAGDELLAAIAGCISRCAAQTSALAARYGGEEFAVLLSGLEAVHAARLGERICVAVGALHKDGVPRIARRITVSVGVACMLPDAEISYDDLIAAADKALFEAKQSGRGRVVVAGTLPVVAAADAQRVA